MPDDPARPPRFPYVGALLCAGCLGAAVWTWMMYSYCWDATPSQFSSDFGANSPAGMNAEKGGEKAGRYVRISGTVAKYDRSFTYVGWPADLGGASEDSVILGYSYVGLSDGNSLVYARVPFESKPSWPAIRGEQRRYAGRVVYERCWAGGDRLPYAIDTTASRFHPASIAGLVVGAMGVFVFSVASRHWLNQRRVSLVETAEDDT